LNINVCKEGLTGLIKIPSEVDKYIKSTVMGDAIQLMKNKSNRLDVGLYKTWQ